MIRIHTPWAKTINKNTNSTQNKSQTHRAKHYEVTSFLSTDFELSTETCSKNVYSLGPLAFGVDFVLLGRAESVLLVGRPGDRARHTSESDLTRLLLSRVIILMLTMGF